MEFAYFANLGIFYIIEDMIIIAQKNILKAIPTVFFPFFFFSGCTTNEV